MRGKDIVIVTPGDRSRDNILLISGMAGAGAILSGVGLYFHLDARSASNQVSASTPTDKAWTKSEQALYDEAHSSTTKAAVFYGIGGALVLASVITLMVTQPESETTIIHPHGTPTVAPTPGGALVGGAWRF
jgi:hypothetical protein